MLTLNLLPPQEKENLKLAKAQRLLVFYSMEVFAVLVIFVILLASTLFFLKIQLKAAERLLVIEEKSVQSVKNLEEEVSGTNQKLRFIDEIQTNSRSFYQILDDLSRMAPSGVEFNSFYYDGQTKKAVLDGYALTRDDFLSFREELKRNSKFSQIESPISNLIQSTDNNFRISFIIE